VAEPDRFAEFVATRSTRLLRTAYLLTHDWAHAEDLLQTSLAKTWFAWRRIHSDPEPYVRRVMVNTYATWWRRRWNGEQPTRDMPERTGRDEYSPIDDRHWLWAALRRLPRRQRAVVVLRFFEDLSEADTAEILGTSIGTVKSQTARALAKLRVDPTLAAARPAATAHEGATP
jgi:RNA polymerase sigma-70 factor (sigma-E family)